MFGKGQDPRLGEVGSPRRAKDVEGISERAEGNGRREERQEGSNHENLQAARREGEGAENENRKTWTGWDGREKSTGEKTLSATDGRNHKDGIW